MPDGYQVISQQTGIRQGCPFSPLAFVLALELLAIKIRQSKDVNKHFQIDNIAGSLTIALYADDITLFLADENDLTNALTIFGLFRGVPW